ncbi:hypothetical protein SAMN05216571_104288 [Onishia taeanensis]|uniref:Uncharacterized protein n=1 Tax=Onishia taeanensis TaxID=284577 RepID=A0A1G7RIR2_9GAMM|nr:hypothetical protein SAMN05216571_104288 [Halomonas taeanensis]
MFVVLANNSRHADALKGALVRSGGTTKGESQ